MKFSVIKIYDIRYTLDFILLRNVKYNKHVQPLYKYLNISKMFCRRTFKKLLRRAWKSYN